MSILPLSRFSSVFAQLKSGDVLCIDIDDTLLLPARNKYKDEAFLTEEDLLTQLAYLRERHVRLLALTARRIEDKAKTEQQLKQLGIVLDALIFAPTIHLTKKNLLQKGIVLANYFRTVSFTPKRIFVIDNDEAQLKAIAYEKNMPAPIVLYHYVRPQRQGLSLLLNPANTFFPENLAGFTQVKSLGGGTASTYCLHNPQTNQTLVLKYGAHANALKLEILCHQIYRVLGVPGPQVEAYNTLPNAIAKKLKLKQAYGLFQVTEYLPTQKISKEQIKKETAKYFVTHVLLGNIDVAKSDNFIGTALIDAGANFMLRAKGQIRKEDPSLASEIDSLRNANINRTAYDWFADLSEEEIKNQVICLARQQDNVEQAIWQAASKLKLSDELRNEFLQYFTDRLDKLITRYCPEEQYYAKTDKKAQVNQTAAGVLTYQIINNKAYLLLAKRIRHCWWDNFGGKSDNQDKFLSETAMREVFEESGGILQYTAWDMLHNPSHDLITTLKNGDVYVYRMYLIKQEGMINLKECLDEEHTQCQWIPVESIIRALEENSTVQSEGQDTLKIQLSPHHSDILLYPPLSKMLQQAPVKEHLIRLSQGKLLANKHTQSKIATEVISNKQHAICSPLQIRQQLSASLLQHTKVIREIKNRHPSATVTTTSNRLSPSELHFKAMLGDHYKKNALAENMHYFYNHYLIDTLPKLVNIKESWLLSNLNQLLQIEKEQNEHYFHFYHACDSKVAFAYFVFTKIYTRLRAQDNWAVFRASKQAFKNFPTIQEFIAYHSKQGEEEINNDKNHFNDCALATNIFLNGNHETPSSCSIHYLISNKSRRIIDLKALLLNILQPFSVSDTVISQLLKIYEEEAKAAGGVLFQMGIPKENVRVLTYPAGSLGVIKLYKGIQDLDTILLELEKDLDNENKELAIEYIKRFQVRVILPPSQFLKINKITQFETKEDYLSDQFLDGIVYTILQNINNLNIDMLDEQAPLLRILNHVYQANEVNATAINTSILAKALWSKNEELVKNILVRFPEMKNSSVPLLPEYITNDSSDEELLSNHPLTPLEIMLRKNYSLALIEYCFDTHWWRTLSENVLRQPELFLLALTKMPAEERLEFVTRYCSYITEGSQLRPILKALPNSDRLTFANRHKEIIKETRDLRGILKKLNIEDRLRYASQFDNILDNGYSISAVMSQLLPEDKHGFAIKYENRINAAIGIAYVLGQLLEDNRLSFAIRHQSKIIDGLDLNYFLEKLHCEDRYMFAMQHLDKIASGSELANAIETFNGANKFEERLKFTIINQNKIENARQASEVIWRLSPENHLEFAIKFQDKIKNGCDAFHIISNLFLKDRLNFAIRHQYKSRVFQEFLPILCLLNNQDRFTYAVLNQNKISHGAELALVLSHLPSIKQVEYACLFLDKLTFSKHEKTRIAEALGENQTVFTKILDTYKHQKDSKSLAAKMNFFANNDASHQDERITIARHRLLT